MVHAEQYKTLRSGGVQTYPEAVRVIRGEYGLPISSRTMETAVIQDQTMQRSHDRAHTNAHLLELARNAELLLRRRPSLRNSVDWSRLFDFVSLHDSARSAIPLTPITLFSAQILEDIMAPIAARKYMEQRWGTIDHELLGIIARHPYHAGHPVRRGKSFSDTEKLAVDIDSLAVLSPMRVDVMYEHIRRAFFGMSLRPFHGFLSGLFTRHANFSFFYDETAEVAKTWREESLHYIKKKFLHKG